MNWKDKINAKAISTIIDIFLLVVLIVFSVSLCSRVDSLEKRLAVVESNQTITTKAMTNVVDVMKRIATTVTR